MPQFCIRKMYFAKPNEWLKEERNWTHKMFNLWWGSANSHYIFAYAHYPFATTCFRTNRKTTITTTTATATSWFRPMLSTFLELVWWYMCYICYASIALAAITSLLLWLYVKCVSKSSLFAIPFRRGFPNPHQFNSIESHSISVI